MRAKAFFINGGAGRVITSIPALEKYAESHDDFVIVAEGGMNFYKSHPILHKYAYDNWHKGLFEDKLKDRDLFQNRIGVGIITIKSSLAQFLIWRSMV